MFFTSERFKSEVSPTRPGPGAYNPEHSCWDNAEGAGAFKAKSERFQGPHGARIRSQRD